MTTATAPFRTSQRVQRRDGRACSSLHINAGIVLGPTPDRPDHVRVMWGTNRQRGACGTAGNATQHAVPVAELEPATTPRLSDAQLRVLVNAARRPNGKVYAAHATLLVLQRLGLIHSPDALGTCISPAGRHLVGVSA